MRPVRRCDPFVTSSFRTLVLVDLAQKYNILQKLFDQAHASFCRSFYLLLAHQCLWDEVSVVSNHKLLESLNDSQRAAVTQINGPLLILAGPGSGKTRVITHRIAYMIEQGVPSYSIIALTFTNKAADEMRVRLERLVGSTQTWTGTFHKFCARLIRQNANMIGLSENFTIYDMGDSKKVMKQAIENAEVNPRHFTPDAIANQISNLKSSAITSEEFQPAPGHVMQSLVARVYPEYQKLLQMANAVDFDDLLLGAVDLLRHNPEIRESLDLSYQYVMVDEYQDTNIAQYQLIRLLNHNIRNLGVTGDPDQSIYGWRGANINNILDFETDFPNVKVVRLEQNYRSTKAILNVADKLIANNVRRKHKSLLTDNEQGDPVRLVAYPNPNHEATDIADSIALSVQKGDYRPRDFAILYRTNWLSRSLEHAMRSSGIPYQVVKGHEFYQRREIKDMLAYLHLLNNPSDNVAFERIVNVPPRKIGKVTLKRVRDYAQSNGFTMLDAARQCGLIDTISKSAATKVAGFVALYDQLSEHRTDDVEMIMRQVINITGYRDWLTADGSEESHERAGNVDELVVAAQEYDNEHPEDGSLETYLEQASLVSDTDAWEAEADYVTLMSLHAAKGLEFPFVFIVGLEDGLLPHERSRDSFDEIEEERRLLFVGITRAKKQLQMSRCSYRFRKGSHWPAIASGFLMELPRNEMQIFEPTESDSFDFPDDDDIPFDIDPWDETSSDLRGSEDDETGEAVSEYKSSSSADADEVNETQVASLSTNSIAKFPRLMTGTEFIKQQEERAETRLHPSMFKEGMTVEHDEYGQGPIVKISGTKMKTIATVNFSDVGKKQFRLAFCNLRIVTPS